ncbi:fimbrial protein [Stenotrophomonas sp. PFBMAA-4]|uniref:fimbrial protein n=1 Tax=Stenotrophomonas sp. PFBMAA-4 TaxID=3043301 RepID=UPI0024B5CDCA|nr:fimbrial protein [Stenotrophomonas sp. PFBMAA-4]MDI9273897.1 fimbrial protein [Stenotrophomonas sp. PFBMAA-4]
MMRPTPGEQRNGKALATCLGLLLAALAAPALACTSSGVGTVYLTADFKASDPPDRVVIVSGRATWMRECSITRAHPMDVSLEPNGLTPVSTIDYDGKTYVTYQLSATSPLFFFPVNVKTSDPGVGGGYERIPASDRAATPVVSYATGSEELLTYPHLGVVARTGMQSVPQTLLGVEVVQHTQFPHSNRHTVFVTVNVEQPTCALSSAGFSLDDISADVLGAAGSSSREQTFQVAMRCDAAGIPVKLTLADANAPTATGSLLKPTANATAQGVQVELLRNGVPVVLGQQWNHGASSAGMQNIDLQARYTRVPGSFSIGEVEGQAVLTADYR